MDSKSRDSPELGGAEEEGAVAAPLSGVVVGEPPLAPPVPSLGDVPGDEAGELGAEELPEEPLVSVGVPPAGPSGANTARYFCKKLFIVMVAVLCHGPVAPKLFDCRNGNRGYVTRDQ
jgi:hypothetical protein